MAEKKQEKKDESKPKVRKSRTTDKWKKKQWYNIKVKTSCAVRPQWSLKHDAPKYQDKTLLIIKEFELWQKSKIIMILTFSLNLSENKLPRIIHKIFIINV